MSMHFMVRFEPRDGNTDAFRRELMRVADASRIEAGCLAYHAFESLKEPILFAVHSEWVDLAAFDLHAGLPHTLRFLRAAETLLTHPVQGLRMREVGVTGPS
jgi:quinol monooxygenase YgiN